MPFTVEEFHDLVRLLEERPEWREELRRLVLTPALLAVPEQIAELRARSEQQFQARWWRASPSAPIRTAALGPPC